MKALVAFLLGAEVTVERVLTWIERAIMAVALCWAVVEWRAGWPRRGSS